MRDKLGRFIKGHKPTYRFKKGESRFPEYQFKKGQHPSPKTEFKKGQQFWLGKKRLNMSGENNPRYKNGTYKHQLGYLLILRRDHPFCNNNGYVREHRLVMEKVLRRYLLPMEVVHHINGIRDDNRIENLMLFVNESAHRKWHHIQEGIKKGEIIFDGQKYHNN